MERLVFRKKNADTTMCSYLGVSIKFVQEQVWVPHVYQEVSSHGKFLYLKVWLSKNTIYLKAFLNTVDPVQLEINFQKQMK